MSIPRVETESGVTPADAERVAVLLQQHAVPRLTEFLNLPPVLPRRIVLTRRSFSGAVPATINPDTGEIVELNDPRIGVGDDVAMGHLLLHELAHYHELSVRRERRLWIPGIGPTIMWTEYFAERTACRAGVSGRDLIKLLPDDDDAGGDENEHAPVDEPDLYSDVPWAAAWLLAEEHAAGENDLDALYKGAPGILRKLYRTFPDWDRRAPSKARRATTIIKAVVARYRHQ